MGIGSISLWEWGASPYGNGEHLPMRMGNISLWEWGASPYENGEYLHPSKRYVRAWQCRTPVRACDVRAYMAERYARTARCDKKNSRARNLHGCIPDVSIILRFYLYTAVLFLTSRF